MMSAEKSADGFTRVVRNVTVDATPGCVRARLVDNVHDFALEISHDDNTVTGIQGKADRTPWVTCPGALARLRELIGVPLGDGPDLMLDKSLQCTHLIDLAFLGMTHARHIGRHHYIVDISAIDATGHTAAAVSYNGTELLRWVVSKQRVISQGPFLDHVTSGRAIWPEQVTAPETRRAALLLRRGLLVFYGTRTSRHMRSASELGFMLGVCHSFQPDTVSQAIRPDGFRTLEPEEVPAGMA